MHSKSTRTRPRTRTRLSPVTVLAALVGILLLATGPAFGDPGAASDERSAADPRKTAADQPTAEAFQQITLAKGAEETGEPMTLAILPDGSVLHTAREGTVRMTDPGGTTRVVGELPVYTHDEEGLQGIGVDPNFAENRYVYLYYAPELDTPPGDAPETGTAEDFAPFEGVNRLSRFVLGEDDLLDLESEQTILEVPTDRGMCCHVGGDIAFDADGNLYLSTGDDSNPFASDGYTPIDDAEGRNPSFDARRSAGNSNDLRGKILRIAVQEDGSYTIPEGNLFTPGTEGTRPEIYAMGLRNPYRISVDPASGIVYVGDYGPDAGRADADRGPSGQVEFNRITEAGNFGWPYCHGANEAYVDYDFATGTSGESFDCAAPVNDSRHNTGLTELPAAQPAWIPYDGASVPEFGDGSESPMAGPVYHYDPDLDSTVKFPESYDGDFMAGEYGRMWIKAIEQAEDGSVAAIEDVPWEGTQVMDMEFGPDGALYVLDYGMSWFGGDEHSALYRIQNASDGYSPVPQAAADVTSGQAPLEIAFSSEGTADPDTPADQLTYHWDFGDGTESTDPHPSHTYTENGTYSATVTAQDPTGKTGTASVHITVGNTAPTVELVLPGDGQLFAFGDEVPFEVRVTDPEDPTVDCSAVTVTYILGHDLHGHPLTSANGCTGVLRTSADSEHDPNANIFGVINARYSDQGAGGQPPLTSEAEHVLQPTHRQAEHYSSAEGVEIVDRDNAHGGKAVGDLQDGDAIAFTPYLLSEATSFTARVSSAGGSGTLEVRANAPDGPLLGSVEVADTGGWESFEEVSGVLEPQSSSSLHLVFRGDSETLYELDDFVLGTG